MAVIDQLKDFVFLEMPQRIVLVQGNEAIGDPNLSILPKIQSAPLGTHYLQDDVNPKVLYVRVNNGTLQDWMKIGEVDVNKLEHNFLNGIQGGNKILNEYIHLSNLEKIIYDNYNNRIDNQQGQINNINKRVSELEQEVFDIPLPPNPTTVNSDINGKTIDLTTEPIKEIVFPIDSTGLVTINDPHAITSNPSIIAGTPYIRKNPITGKDELVVPVSGLSDGQHYEIQIKEGLISDNGIPNTNNITTSFETLGTLKEPIIKDGSLNGLDNVDITTTTELLFEVIGNSTGSINLINNKAWSSSTPNIIDGNMELITVGSQQFIKFKLHNLQENMKYSIDILSGAIENVIVNKKYVNMSGKNCTFKTTPSNTILTTPTLSSLIDFTTFNKIIIPISTSSGRHFSYTIDSSKITSIPSIISNCNIVGNNLVINLNSLSPINSYQITIDTDAILNDGKGNLIQSVINFTTGDNPPLPIVLNNTSVNGSIQPLSLNKIEFDITGGLANDLVVNGSNVVCTPNIIKKSSVDTTNNKLIVEIDNNLINPNTNYILKINKNSVGYKGDNINTFGITWNNNEVICSFTSVNIPKITIPNIIYYNASTGNTIIEFALSNKGFTYLGGITGTNCNINNVNIIDNKLLVEVNGLTYSSDYGITIPINSIDNGMQTNISAVNYNFKTKGEMPTYSIPSINNTTVNPTSISTITIPITFGSGINIKDFDVNKIYSPQGIIKSAIFNSSTNEITITFKTLEYSKKYEVYLYDGMILADKTESQFGYFSFTTIDNTTPPVIPPSSSVLWEYEFVLKNARNEYDLNTDVSFTYSLPTIDDLYTNNKIEMYYLGYDGTLITPKKVPIEGVDTFTAPTLDGSYSFWQDGLIVFNSGTPSNKRFKIIKKI